MDIKIYVEEIVMDKQICCKECKFYVPFTEGMLNTPRGDGYCNIARISPCGMVTVNCDDDFYCAYAEAIDGKK